MSTEPQKKIYTAINLIMSEIGAVEKNRRNQQQSYNFRGIDDFYVALQPLLVKHKAFFAPTVIDQSREERKTNNGGLLIYTRLTVKFTFYSTEDGSFFDIITVGEGMDSGDKSSNKAMSSAAKYAIIPVFCVPTEEPKDSENDNPQPLPKGDVNATGNTSTATAGSGPAIAPKNGAKPTTKSSASADQTAAKTTKTGVLSVAQINRLFKIAAAQKWDMSQVQAFMIKRFKKGATKLLTKDEYDLLVDEIQKFDYETAMGGLQ